ncbi:YciC family protein [Spongorhabdus nitratireducens]
MNHNKMFKPLREALCFFRSFGLPVWGVFFLSGLSEEWFYLMLVDGSTSDTTRAMAQGMVSFAIEPLAAGIALTFIHQVNQGQPAALTLALSQSLPYYPRLLATFLLGGMLIVAGLALYILPGLFLMYKLLFSELHVLLENQQPVDAMRASFKQTKGKAEKIAPAFAIMVASVMLLDGLSDQFLKQWLDPAPFIIAKKAIVAIPAALLAIVVYRLYSQTQRHPLSPS